MASIKTPRGRFHYTSMNLYLGIKQIDRIKAFDNLKILIRVLTDAGVSVSPAFGTLLGIIRENNFIEWDEDIDLFILKEDKEKFLNALWDLKEEGFELIRQERVGHLYSIIRNGEYIDFYVMEPVSPEVRTTLGGGFVFEKYLTDLIDWNFNGLTVKIPREYEQCLEFMYGDWRTPVQYANYKMSRWQIMKKQILASLKQRLPLSMYMFLLKKYHRKDLEKFLEKCEKKSIKLQFSIRW